MSQGFPAAYLALMQAQTEIQRRNALRDLSYDERKALKEKGINIDALDELVHDPESYKEFVRGIKSTMQWHTTEGLGSKPEEFLKDYGPTSPLEGPPLPKKLGIRWPWKK